MIEALPMLPGPGVELIGSLLDGRYRIDSLLGRGGMGDVYVGEDTRLKRKCALKVLHAALAIDRSNIERFLREAQMIASLDHPNIVDIYAYGEEPSGLVFFAMELLQGEDLDARLRARTERPFSIYDCCLWGLQIAQAVAVVHEAGLIHRDLKTSNVFLARRRDGEEVCKLLDFGIARAEDNSELTKTGVALGTPSYMSPEQIRSIGVDRRSDIYSFGVLLFKLLVGRVPFSGDPIQVAMQHCETPVPPPSSVAPDAGISPTLDALVLKAMAKRPDERFQSMREVEIALLEILRIEAPELAPAAQRTRTLTQQSIHTHRPRTQDNIGHGPVGPTFDSATPGPSPRLDRTLALSSQPAGQPRWLYVLTTMSVLGVVILTGVVILARQRPEPTSADILSTVEDSSAKTAPTELSPANTQSVPDVVPAPSFTASPPEPVVAANVEPPEPPQPAPPTNTTAMTDVKASPTPVTQRPVTPSRTTSTTSATKSAKAPAETKKPSDPISQIELKAKKCRTQFKTLDGPKITIDYAIGLDGKVTRSRPSVSDDLGKCLADAVTSTQFEPKLMLGQKISL